MRNLVKKNRERLEMARIKVIRRSRAIKRNEITKKVLENNIRCSNNNNYGVLTRSEAKKLKACCQNSLQHDAVQTNCRLLELPVEIQLKIMGYLGCRDLEALKRTSKMLESIALHPSLWKEYEILDVETSPVEIISNLKRMSLLKKIVIRNRIDTDNIVRQISLSNKHLEELHIAYKFWDMPMFLKSTMMTRLVERCHKLHTISMDGVYCRSLKLYRLLGKKVFGNLRSLNVKMTMSQIRAFISHLNEQSRDNVYKSLRELGPRYWKVVRYLRCSDLRLIRKVNTH